MKMPNLFAGALAGFATVLLTSTASADCTLTNVGLMPLPELGLARYKGSLGGLYPHDANPRPPAHLADGLRAATNRVKPLNASGAPDPVSGKIVLLSIGMSNTTQEWASKGTNSFYRLCVRDPSLNPQVKVVDGAIGGKDAVQWTNINAGTWNMVITQRLAQAGVTTNQVQAIWLKQALAGPLKYGAFPQHAQALRNSLAMILRNAKAAFPNLQLAYLSCRTRAYVDTPTALNPEPFAFETAFADKWLIEDQIEGRNNLNFDPARGPVVAPWVAWGPYIWVDGLTTRSDGLRWLCSDLESDFTHPSATGGVPKVAAQLLAFFKTDPTTRPWFLRTATNGQPPTCAATASVTAGVAPLTVQFSPGANDPDGSIREYAWTFDDGEFSFQPSPVKVFPAPGLYTARLTVTDNSNNVASGSVTIQVDASLALWRQAVFTPSELANPLVSGEAADPDRDGLPNLLEYAMELDPKQRDTAAGGFPTFAASNGEFTLAWQHYKPAADVTLTVESSTNFADWTPVPGALATDLGNVEALIIREPVTAGGAKFFRFKAVRSTRL